MIFIPEKEVMMVQENSSSYFLSYGAVDTNYGPKFPHFFTYTASPEYAFTLSIEAKRSTLKLANGLNTSQPENLLLAHFSTIISCAQHTFKSCVLLRCSRSVS